jgi:hypothetical protein
MTILRHAQNDDSINSPIQGKKAMVEKKIEKIKFPMLK